MEKKFGKYTLIERLGGGGMAEVFKARLRGPAGFEKHLALKLILPHISNDPEFVRMFIHEATLAARLDHANIVRIHEFDRIDDRYYIAMELVDGKDLRAVLARAREVDRPLRVGEAVITALEVCRGLAFAHGELTPGTPEVIHRDISPHNIILSRAGEVKITDFGIAKLASAASQTRTGTVKGKLAYMSPEQAGGEVLDRRSDLFSIGCVQWEMLTGQRLFAGPNEMATLENLKNAPILPPSAHNPDVPAELDQLVLHALSRDRTERVGSASEMGRRLDHVLIGLPDLDRATALSAFFQDLFGTTPVRKGTAVLQPEPAVEVRGEPTPPMAVAPSGDEAAPSGVKPVEPAGPDADTAIEPIGDDEPAIPPAPTRWRSFFRWWTVGPFLAVFGMMLVVLWTPGGTEVAQVSGTGTGTGMETDGVTEEADEADEGPEAAQAVDIEIEEETPADADEREPVGARFGRLNLNVIPWAEVFRGKHFVGDTPLDGERLPVGWHTLVLVNEDLDVRRTIRVRIRPNRLTKEVVDLRKPAATRAP